MSAPAADVLTALDSLDEGGLQEVVQRATALLRAREQARHREAIEQARAILASAGLSVHDLVGAEARPAAAPKAKKAGANGQAGARYANPADPSQVYLAGRGRAPRWYRELKERGALPDPLP
jgi:DNA-binding protein H-NS